MMMTRKNRKSLAGFTLIELMIVISIITILLAIAIPNYQRSIVRAREARLRNDLYAIRSVIDQYTLDKQKAPQSLQDLVQAGYLRDIPTDPVTNSKETWRTVSEDTLMAIDQSQPGIVDVHSGSSAVSTEGTAYSSW